MSGSRLGITDGGEYRVPEMHGQVAEIGRAALAGS
jgi:hypothetical protein